MTRFLKIIFGLCVVLAIFSCGAEKQGDSIPQLRLVFKGETGGDFDPDIDHGQIDKFKITISGDGFKTPRVSYFPSDVSTIEINDLPTGEDVSVKAEAINYNGYTIKRGVSEPVTIVGGKTATAQITVHHVPIFANVKDGATIKLERFIPKIFATGEMDVELTDAVGTGEPLVLEDIVSGAINFSVSPATGAVVKPVFIQALSRGLHTLTVIDRETHEKTQIAVNAINASTNKPLITTSGAYLGSFDSIGSIKNSSLNLYFEKIVQSSGE
ncbi:MAG: hypothetical protein HQM16_13590 [Deltaproteobacteria bacterium]|nr:hypothetical protein [Deltaproteobacteria bacterium]